MLESKARGFCVVTWDLLELRVQAVCCSKATLGQPASKYLSAAQSYLKQTARGSVLVSTKVLNFPSNVFGIGWGAGGASFILS